MMQSAPLYEALLGFWNELKSWPEDAHLFCPKVDDFDIANYEDLENVDDSCISTDEKKKRVADSNNRHITTYRLSLLLGIRPEDAGSWLTEWKDKVNSLLARCDACVRSWHRSREAFIKALEGYLPSPRRFSGNIY